MRSGVLLAETPDNLAGIRADGDRVELISELYGEVEATLVYDVHTATPVGTQRTVGYFRLDGDKITWIVLLFDASSGSR